jgi:hypothetical protein
MIQIKKQWVPPEVNSNEPFIRLLSSSMSIYMCIQFTTGNVLRCILTLKVLILRGPPYANSFPMPVKYCQNRNRCSTTLVVTTKLKIHGIPRCWKVKASQVRRCLPYAVMTSWCTESGDRVNYPLTSRIPIRSMRSTRPWKSVIAEM